MRFNEKNLKDKFSSQDFFMAEIRDYDRIWQLIYAYGDNRLIHKCATKRQLVAQ